MARKEIDLPTKAIKALQALAEKDNRKLKPFMEMVLVDYSEKKQAPTTNTHSHAKREMDILGKTSGDAVVIEFTPEILALCEAFGKSGQSGGSAPYVARALAKAIEKLCLHETIAPLTGEKSEWGTVADQTCQNNRDSAVFRKSEGEKAYYLNAIIWQGEDEFDSFTGMVEGVTSSQYIKAFPFIPKSFRINVRREKYDQEIHGKQDDSCEDGVRVVSCGSGDYVYFIKDKKQLDEVFSYYDRFTITKKS